MKLPTLPANGRCRCGETEFRVTAQPILTAACHCRGCQRMSASAFSLTALIPTDAFEVLRGEPVIGGARHPEQRHHFCPRCCTWVYTQVMPEFVNVRAMLLDDASWFAPFIETWACTRLPWATTGATHSFDEFPPLERFPELLEEYARAAAR